MKKRKIFLTTALPYANSDIHIGHLVEHFAADIWTRFQKMQGHEVTFVSADDTHGTPVMLAAQKAGITPEQLIAKVFVEHQQSLSGFGIQYDHYSNTHSKENRELCEAFFHKMQSKNAVRIEAIEQLYCLHDKMFLPDRFVRGTCPKCKSPNQYGDSCDRCGSTYSPTQLIDAACTICGTAPELRKSNHFMFELEKFREVLLEWLPKHTAPGIAAKMMEWYNEPLRSWDISREAPYFGFEIPGHPQQYFYVWVDAPMGYLSTFRQYLEKNGKSFLETYQDPNLEVLHLIGKDIVYFHTLFWPALLSCADMRLPSQVVVHGHLTINGEKMSKSKGTQILAKQYLKHLDPEHLRYFFASKMPGGFDDFDFAFNEFENRVNSELIGKITNLASRSCALLQKNYENKLAANLDPKDLELLKQIEAKLQVAASFFDRWELAKAMNEIRESAEILNRYFDSESPWKTADLVRAHHCVSTTLNGFRLIAIALAPVLPAYALKAQNIFSETSWNWSNLQTRLTGKTVQPYQHLSQRIEKDKMKAFEEDLKTAAAKENAENPKTQNPIAQPAPLADQHISIEQFNSIDLRIARIIEAESVPNADKLLRLKVDVGPIGEKQIFAGIKSAYDPATLVGRFTVIVSNLKPRQMKFGLSEGMVLAAGAGGKDLFILSPDSGAKPGDRVK